MTAYVLRRFVYAIFLLFIASLFVFYGLRVAPGDVTDYIRTVTSGQEFGETLREQLGLNEPLPAQYFVFVKNYLSGDPGNSIITGAPITEILKDSGVNTVKLGASAIIIVYLLAIPLGLFAAWRRNSPQDQTIRFLAVLGMGVPNFFLAILLIQLFAVKLGWFPVAGPGGLRHLVLPAVVLALESLAINIRLMRSSVLEEAAKDYMRTLRAKGLRQRRIMWAHALRNSLVPVVAFAGIVIPLILGYTLIVEVIFRFQGIGFQLVESIQNRDYALAQSLALLFTAVVIFSNFLADIGHQLLDPRVRERTVAR
ncbi:MAG: ABC transporter permease [Actinomycetia bacterium]|nr:ABC transporter permease [Actinomycetes bacterium]